MAIVLMCCNKCQIKPVTNKSSYNVQIKAQLWSARFDSAHLNTLTLVFQFYLSHKVYPSPCDYNVNMRFMVLYYKVLHMTITSKIAKPYLNIQWDDL